MYKDKFFRLEKHFSDGAVTEPEVHRIDDIKPDWKTDRRGFIAGAAVGLASLELFKKSLFAEQKSDNKENVDSCGLVPPHGENISGMMINAGSDMLATGSSDTFVKLWEFPSGRVLGTLKGHTSHVWKVKFTSDSRHLFTSSPKDMKIKMWDVKKKTLLGEFEGHTAMVRAMAVTNDDRYLLSGSDDKTLRIWSVEDIKAVKVLQCRDSYYDVVVSPDSSFAFLGGWSKSVAILDLKKMAFVNEDAEAHPGSIIWGISLLSDGNCVSLAKDGLKVWNSKTGKAERSYRVNDMECRKFAVMPDGKMAVVVHYNSSTEKHIIEIVSLPSFEVKGMIPDVKAMQLIKIIENGRYLTGVGYDNNIYVYDLEKLQARATVSVPVKRIICPYFSPDGKYLTLSGVDKDVFIYSLPGFSIHTCLSDGAALDKGKTARMVEMSDSSGRKVVRAVPADREKPSGSTCTCDTVIGTYVKPEKRSEGGGSGWSSGGGSHCSCNRVCTCVPVK